MSAHICIRLYREADWPRLQAIHDAARLDELRASRLTDAYLTLEQTADNEGLFDGSVWVAEVDGQVQGFAALHDDELSWLYVHPSCYRRGIGRALLRHVIAAQSTSGGGKLTAEVLLGNDIALALYQAEGFRIAERIDGRMTGNEQFAASGYLLQREA